MDALDHARNLVLINGMLSATFLILYFQERNSTVDRDRTRKFLFLWSLGWFILILRAIVEYISFTSLSMPLLNLSNIFLLIAIYCIVEGTLIHAGHKPKPYLLYIVIGVIAARFITVVFDWQSEFILEIVTLGIKIGLVYTALVLATSRKIIGPARWLAVVGFLLWALENPTDPTLRPLSIDVAKVRVLATIAQSMLTFGLLLSYISIRKAQFEAVNENLRLVAEQSYDVIFRFEVKPVRRYSFVSPSCWDVFGYTEEEFRSNSEILFGMTNDEGRQKLIDLEEGNLDISKPISIKLQNRHGKDIVIEISISKRIDQTGELHSYGGIIRDITERVEIENQLRHSQKMEAVGLLAGSISHDFNNVLTAISGHAELALIHAKDDPEIREEVEEIFKSTERASNLTRKLLAFSRKQELAPKIISISDHLADMEKLLGRLVGEEIELRILKSSDETTVLVDPVQFEQIILNLVVNARDSVDFSGTIEVESGIRHFSSPAMPPNLDLEPGEYVFVAVKDNGTGIPEEIQSRIFEPFFSTKEAGKGTGLGLATVYGIARQSKGWIEVDSEVGKGSTFTVYFPHCADKEDTAGR